MLPSMPCRRASLTPARARARGIEVSREPSWAAFMKSHDSDAHDGSCLPTHFYLSLLAAEARLARAGNWRGEVPGAVTCTVKDYPLYHHGTLRRAQDADLSPE